MRMSKERKRNKGPHAGKPASHLEDVKQQIDEQNIRNFGGTPNGPSVIPPDPGAVERMEAHDANVAAEKAGAEAEQAEDQKPKVSSSVVNAKFKARYTANARELGIKGKAARRSNWDWLAQEIAKRCLSKDKIDIDKFLDILDANGVDYSKWTNRSRG